MPGCCWATPVDRGGDRVGRPRGGTCPDGVVRARWLVNAAGLGADRVDRMLGRARLHGDPPAGPAPGLRQAGPAAARPHPPARAHRADQGGAGVADDLGQRAARPDRRGPRGPHRHRHRRPRGVAGLLAAGRRILPGAGGRGGDGRLRRTAGGHRAPRLPDPLHADRALRDRGRHPVDRADGVAGHRRARGRTAGRGRGARGRGRPSTAPPPSMPPLGRGPGPPDAGPGADRRRPGLRHRRCATASRSAGARCATPATDRWPPPTSVGCAAGPGP